MLLDNGSRSEFSVQLTEGLSSRGTSGELRKGYTPQCHVFYSGAVGHLYDRPLSFAPSRHGMVVELFRPSTMDKQGGTEVPAKPRFLQYLSSWGRARNESGVGIVGIIGTTRTLASRRIESDTSEGPGGQSRMTRS